MSGGFSEHYVPSSCCDGKINKYALTVVLIGLDGTPTGNVRHGFGQIDVGQFGRGQQTYRLDEFFVKPKTKNT